MKNVLVEYIKIEFPEGDYDREYNRLIHSLDSHYHWCSRCKNPQFIPRKMSCSEKMEGYKVPPCPTCNPEKFYTTCPQCKVVLYVNHGCGQVRHCVYGEKCGANRTKKKMYCGVEWEVPDPVECDHGGCCGCIFNINPKPNDLREMGLDLNFSQEKLDRLLSELYGKPLILLEYYTRHDAKCECPCCENQPRPPKLFQSMKMAQELKLYEEVARQSTY